MSDITIKGRAKIVKIYNLAEIEGLDIDNFDLNSKEEIDELYNSLNELTEIGEADSISSTIIINGINADDATITVDNQELTVDDIILKNENIKHIIADIEHAKEGDLFFIKTLEGEGTWNFKSDKDIKTVNNISLEYADCSIMFDQFDLLREGYLDFICDTILPETISHKGVHIELDEFYLTPTQSYGELYLLKKELISKSKILERITDSGRVLAGTDFDVDDIEAN